MTLDDVSHIRKIMATQQYLCNIHSRIGIAQKDLYATRKPPPDDYYLDPQTFYWLPKNVYYLIPNNL